MDLLESVAQWCRGQIEVREKAHDLMQSGVVQYNERHPDGRLVNTTAKSIEDNRRETAELRDMLSKIERNRSA